MTTMLLLALLGADPASAEKPAGALTDVLEQEFIKPLHPGFQWFGSDQAFAARQDRLGMRIDLPARRAQHDAIGIATRFRISGDFDITTTYDVLAAGKPEQGFGVGVNLWCKIGEHPPRAVLLGHYNRPGVDNQIVAQVTTWDEAGEKSLEQWRFNPEGMSGRLRLVRTGNLLQFLVAEGESTEFSEIQQAEVGSEDVLTLRAAATTSNAEVPLSARFRNLTIRADSLSIQGTRPATSNALAWWSGMALVAGIGFSVVIWRRRKAK